MQQEKDFPIGRTYDDVLLIPQRSSIRSRKDVSTTTFLSKRIELKVPIVASNMDTVCEAEMAIAMAREGGIGILHRFCSIAEQCRMVNTVKRAQSFVVRNPRQIAPDATREEAFEAMQWDKRGVLTRGLVVVGPGSKKLLGIVTNADLQFAARDALVQDLMVPVEKLVVLKQSHYNPDDIDKDKVRQLMHQKRVHSIPVVDHDGNLLCLITASDMRKMENTNACVDSQLQLRVGAAVGVKVGDEHRAEALVAAGADVLVIDIAHGHSDVCIDMLKRLKANPKTNKVDVIAGNIATKEGAEDLIAAGADGLKVGVGPGSICITRIVAGSGVPQLFALMEIAKVAHKARVPIIADGGIKTSGDCAKAIAAGASTVMVGNMLAGTDESPGQVLVKDGRKVKIIRGMAGYGANISKAEREKNASDDVFANMVPEGVEGNVPYKGPVSSIVRNLVGGLRSGMSYCGSRTVPETWEKARFIGMTASGLRESSHHDISKL